MTPIENEETVPVEVRELVARALNSVLGSEDDEHPRYHPAQSSWEKPSEVWWTQWLEAADAVLAVLADRAIRPSPPADAGDVERLREIAADYEAHAPEDSDGPFLRSLAERLAAHPAPVTASREEIAQDERDRLYAEAHAIMGVRLDAQASWAMSFLADRGAMLPADRRAAREVSKAEVKP